jgi:hypothetical protein
MMEVPLGLQQMAGGPLHVRGPVLGFSASSEKDDCERDRFASSSNTLSFQEPTHRLLTVLTFVTAHLTYLRQED